MAQFLLLLAAVVCLVLVAARVVPRRVDLAFLAAALIVVAVWLLPAAQAAGIRWG